MIPTRKIVRRNGNVVLEKTAHSITDGKENECRHSQYGKQQKKAYKQSLEKTSRIYKSRDYENVKTFSDNREGERSRGYRRI